MKKSKPWSVKFLSVLGMWFIAGMFFMTLPALNISCDTAFIPPPPPPPSGGSDFNIRLNGGNSTLGEGENAGFLLVNANGGGNVDVGVANPGIPQAPDASGAPGPNTAGACVVQGTMTFAAVEALGPPCDNGPVDNILLLSGHLIVDGTLTLSAGSQIFAPPNPDIDVNITPRGSIIGPSFPLLVVSTGNVYVQGTIDLSGADSSTLAGGPGGGVNIQTIDAFTTGNGGSIIITGLIDTSGGDHTGTGVLGLPGGFGGNIQFITNDDHTSPFVPSFVIGKNAILDTHGGSSTDIAPGAFGADAGLINMLGQAPGQLSDEVSVFINGRIIADGGNSVVDLGGNGSGAGLGGMVFQSEQPGSLVANGNPIYLTGNISANGGVGDGSNAPPPVSSSGGGLNLQTENGNIVVASDIDLKGGDTFGVTTAGNSMGGFLNILSVGTGNITLVGGDGNIQANGGNGFNCTFPANGCFGGVVNFISGIGNVNANGIIEANGGDESSGATVGGLGGQVVIGSGAAVAGSTVTNNMKINANGGYGPVTGGIGGLVQVISDQGNIIITGSSSIEGGESGNTGGEGGFAIIQSDISASNTGGPITNRSNIHVSGGFGRTNGGEAGMIYLSTSNTAPGGNITNTGDLIANGGDSLGNGGSGDGTTTGLWLAGPCRNDGGTGTPRTICFNTDLNQTAYVSIPVAGNILIDSAKLRANGGQGNISDGPGGHIEVTASDELGAGPPPTNNDDTGTVSILDSLVTAIGSGAGTIILIEDPNIDNAVTSVAGSSFNPAEVQD